jgi:PDZ domain-containing protein
MSDPDAHPDADTIEPPLPDGPVAPPYPLRRRRWPIVLSAIFVLLGAGALTLENWHVNYYALTPGRAQPVTPFISVPAADDHPLHGQILLTDVDLNPVSTEWQYLYYRFLASNNEIESAASLTGSEPEAVYLAQNFLIMAQTQDEGTAAALKVLGYTIAPRNAGVLVIQVGPNSPAAGVLSLAQVIENVNGIPTPTGCALVEALHGLLPGSKATLSVERQHITTNGSVVAGSVVQKTVKLGTPPKKSTITGCGAPITPTAYLGIGLGQQIDWNFPVKVSVHILNIGGPSAGLATALGIIDKLSGGHLTGNRIVAATGTIDADGNVGDVGGVAEKTIAVEQANATVFFVPPQELAAARSKATPGLHVFAVSTLAQALSDLKHLGGTVPSNHVPAQAAP